MKELPFKSNQAAFEYALEYMSWTPGTDARIVGIIQEVRAKDSFIVHLAIKGKDGRGAICGDISASLCAKYKIPKPTFEPGDLVAVDAASYDPKTSVDYSMNYFVIVAKLTRVFSMEYGGFIPSGLRPEKNNSDLHRFDTPRVEEIRRNMNKGCAVWILISTFTVGSLYSVLKLVS